MSFKHTINSWNKYKDKRKPINVHMLNNKIQSKNTSIFI